MKYPLAHSQKIQEYLNYYSMLNYLKKDVSTSSLDEAGKTRETRRKNT